MRSLAFKLTLAFLMVGIAGILLVALFVSQRTQSEFDQFVLDRFQVDLVAELADYYRQNGSWDGITAIAVRDTMPRRRAGPGAPAPVTLVDKDRTVVYSHHYAQGEKLPPQVRGQEVPIAVDGGTVGWLLFDTPAARGISASSPEADFLVRIRQAIAYGSVGALAAALLLGIVLARTLTRPIRELTLATRALSQGALGAQVPVRSEDEMGELATAFNQMSADLARSVELRRQMTADIAHDLRTPLSVILGYTEALADGKLPGTTETYEVMHGEAQQLQRLIEDLRTLSLADAGELSLNRQPTSPRALLDRTAAAYMPRAHDQGIDLQIDAATDLPRVSVDPERMAQVLGNLVSNALRYTRKGGRVLLTAVAAGSGVRLLVQDSGEGIASADLPHIFDRFYRADTARSQEETESGLGLAIAKSLVEAHDGTIAVESSRGIGTTFTISLPVAT